MEFGFPHSNCRLRKVQSLQFSVVSPDEMREMSVTQEIRLNGKLIPAGVTKAETYNQGRPVIGGLKDPRLKDINGKGTIDESSGYFGHIELARPMFHVGFLETTLKCLRSVCFHCGLCLTDARNSRFKQSQKKTKGKRRLKAVSDLCRTKTVCEYGEAEEVEKREEDMAAGLAASEQGERKVGGHGGCGGMQPKYIREGLKLFVEFPDQMDEVPGNGDRKQNLPAKKVHEIFKNVSDADIVALGLHPRWSRPEWLLVTVMPVPPPHVRPAVALDGLSKGEDDLTHKLADIVKANSALTNCVQKGEPSHIVEQFELLLQYHLATYLDNELPGQPQAQQKSGKPLKTIRQRLRGKEGRIRGNLMGKRVDFSARTVITADPNLGIDQVGVPRSIARNLTYPERITPFNLSRCIQMVKNGPEEHPGAKYIIREDGSRIDLRYVKSGEMPLKPGWIVERHVQDDDFIVFNRQPSLHKMSIMGHRVKVLDYSTFRLNLSVTAPYNADFDGDEMNLHVPQSVTARAEVQQMMMVPRVIISGQANKPVMGIVQDSLLGVQKMTKRNVMIEKDVLFNLLMWVEDWDGRVPIPAIMKPVSGQPGRYTPLWTGKQIFTLFCPEIDLASKSMTFVDEEKDGIDKLFPTDTKVQSINSTPYSELTCYSPPTRRW
jgi:DNA-directed RNA polymerase II subunit RPB1